MNRLGKTCYFFGTFNPIHYGHLLMAEMARTQFDFEQVLFIPAFVSPHRQNESSMALFQHRLAMAELACADNPYFQVSNIEGQRGGPSYTVDTLRLLETGSSRLPLIIGGDALMNLGTWHQPEVLIQKSVFLQATRALAPIITHVEVGTQEVPIQTFRIEMPIIGISSTQIRERLATGKSIRYWTPPEVVMYLQTNDVYAKTPV